MEENNLEFTFNKWLLKKKQLDKLSQENYWEKLQHPNKHHPIRPYRGELFVVELGINVGFEFSSLHLSLIIQNDIGNTFRNTTIIIPITDYKDGKFDKYVNKKITNEDLESKVLNGLNKDPSKLKLEDIRIIDKARLEAKIGKVKPEYIKEVENKLKKLLSFD